jgi:5-oxoprolinase (ATP-hydrolysing)
VHTLSTTPPTPERSSQPQGWCFWIDRGGTFTDIVAVSPAGHWHTEKLLSVNPEQYVDAASEGVQRLLHRHGSPGDAVAEIRLGTTVATNALLEHAGAKVALVVTAGFADLPVIRQQDRPQLFHRELRRPAPLFACVIEAAERMTHDGSVLMPLDATASHSLQTALVAARQEGCEAVAICFLHGWAHPGHELVAAAAARAAGFTQVFCSHQVSPLPRWVPRADTTLADAYLTPVLQRYIQGFSERVAPLAPREVAFMQSHGGLTDAAGFRGVDALLSGPAGGLVGLQGVGRAAGYEQLIGFDMGGTSTDVALIDGNLPRRPVNRLAGLTLQVPMLDIHTVAAGGGSVLQHTDGRLTAGPASAGAHPGPRCYRRGGPLAITDANVLLGRLLPERFPQVFGPAANEGLDVAAVRKAFVELADEVKANTAHEVATGEASDDDVDHTAQLAEDFLAVAVGAMANAVRHVALRAGHDPEQFTLVCFGGAGGQHACQVAAALGMRRVLVHPLASVLSAVGIGLAPRRQVVRRGEGRNLAAVVAGGLAEAFAPLQQAPWPDTRWTRYLQLRLPGTDATLPVEWIPAEWVPAEWIPVEGSAPHDATLTTTPDNAMVCRLLAERFATLYRQRYGFLPSAEDLHAERLIVDALEVEAVADADRVLAGAPALDREVFPPANTRAWFDGAWHDTPVLDRAALAAGTCVAGPALITDDGATTVIVPGWQATVLKHGELLLEPAPKPTAESVPEQANEIPTPARLEIFNGLYMQVAEQMGLVLRDAARSVNVKERLDFSCAVFAADGSLVANAPHMPVHLGSMGASVRAVQTRLAEREQQAVEGDAWLVNVPWGGGTHLPDVTAVSPVLLAGETAPRFWVASRAHHADLGGITPGSMPPSSTCIEEEGITFDAFQMVAAGTFLDAELRQQLANAAWPARNPDHNVADVQAQLAANARGATELRRLCAQQPMMMIATEQRAAR